MLTYRSALAAALIIACVLVAAMSASAATASYSVSRTRDLMGGGDSSPLQITPFDASLGTLDSVTATATAFYQIRADFTAYVPAVVSWNAAVGADPISELGWGNTTAQGSGTSTGYYQNGIWVGSIVANSSASAGPTTITSNFGRFAGGSPFDVDWWNFYSYGAGGYAPYIRNFSFGGSYGVKLDYSYDYTPKSEKPRSGDVPELSSILLAVMGLPVSLGFARLRRR